MTYLEAVDYIHARLAFGVQPGLSRISALLQALGNPHKKLRFVHVAGTNGKGTTANMLSRILVDAGFKTGLFTSPYVFSFCERIQVNHQNISEEALADVVSRVRCAVEQVEKKGVVPTEFETITAAALLYFQMVGCDLVVLEVGLGGRFDATNVIDTPLVSVITSIALDHTQILGDTLAQIAAEKAGILKENGKAVTTARQAPEVMAVLQQTASTLHNTFLAADPQKAEILSESLAKTTFLYERVRYTIPLVGAHQVENAVSVIEAARLLPGVTVQNIQNGLQKAVMPGRMEVLPGKPCVLRDGGHNPACGTALRTVLRRFAPAQVTAVVGMMADKDMAHYLAQVLPCCTRVIFTKPDNPRAAPPALLQQRICNLPLATQCIEQPQAAYQTALRETDVDGMVLVCGSFYLLSDIAF